MKIKIFSGTDVIEREFPKEGDTMIQMGLSRLPYSDYTSHFELEDLPLTNRYNSDQAAERLRFLETLLEDLGTDQTYEIALAIYKGSDSMILMGAYGDADSEDVIYSLDEEYENPLATIEGILPNNISMS